MIVQKRLDEMQNSIWKQQNKILWWEKLNRWFSRFSSNGFFKRNIFNRVKTYFFKGGSLKSENLAEREIEEVFEKHLMKQL